MYQENINSMLKMSINSQSLILFFKLISINLMRGSLSAKARSLCIPIVVIQASSLF